MNAMNIPNKALEAATDAIIAAAYGQELPEPPFDLALAALEAAAPFMTCTRDNEGEK